MPNIIDSLLLQVGFDTSNVAVGRRQLLEEFKQVRNESSSVAKTLEAEGKRAAEVFVSIKTEALALLGVLAGTAGIGAAIRQTTNDLTSLKYAAGDLGLDPRKLQIFGIAMEREVHGSSDRAFTTLKKLQAELQQWKTFGAGNSSIAGAGVQLDINPETMNAMDVVDHLAKWWEKSPIDVQRKLQLLRGIGLDDDTIHWIRLGAEKTRQALEAAAPDALTNAQIDRLFKLGQAYDKLKTAMEGLWLKTVAEDVAPWLIPLLDHMKDLVHEFEDFTDKNPQFAEAMKTAGAAMGIWLTIGTAGTILTLTGRILGLGAAVRGLALALAALKSPWALLMLLNGDTAETPEEKAKREAALSPEERKARTDTPGQINRWGKSLWNYFWGDTEKKSEPEGAPRAGPRANRTPSAGSGSGFGDKSGDLKGSDIKAFIMHHTGGRGTVEGVVHGLEGRGLGVEYIMDREGKIHTVGGRGAKHIMPGWGEGAGLDNSNTVGMEIIANDDKDLTPAQIQAAKDFIAQNYPNTPVKGHGEVNPGHKQATEGLTIAEAIRAERLRQKFGPRATPKKWTADDPNNPINLVDPNDPTLFPPRDNPMDNLPLRLNSSSNDNDAGRRTQFSVGQINIHTKPNERSLDQGHRALANEIMTRADRGIA